MNPDEIMRMDKERNQLVLVQGGKPIMARKIRWYKEPYFKKRAFAISPPFYSDICTEIKDYNQLFGIHAMEVADIKERQAKVNQERMKNNVVKTAVSDVSGTAPENKEQSAMMQSSEVQDEHAEKITVNGGDQPEENPEPEAAADTAEEGESFTDGQPQAADLSRPRAAGQEEIAAVLPAEENNQEQRLRTQKLAATDDTDEQDNNSRQFQDWLNNQINNSTNMEGENNQ